MILLYDFFVSALVLGLRIASLWNTKAKEWINGRREIFAELTKKIHPDSKFIWVHCSSAGEFEQAKPIIESLKHQFSSYKILVSFFSPSGYKTAKNYPFADIICYLPSDTRSNAQRFIKLINPSLVLFIKYDFWYHYLSMVSSEKIPLLLVSAVFRKDQVFFKGYGRFYRKMLFFFTHIFVQNEDSLRLLKANSIKNCSVTGDTRFDRVKEIAMGSGNLELINKFKGTGKIIVAGSTWPKDEQLLAGFMEFTDLKLILAPHEINETHLRNIDIIFKDSIRYSQLDENSMSKKVLVIDNLGMLSQLYRIAMIAYIGGGFSKDGIHNILEAAVYGKPVIFGPNYKKYREGNDLVAKGGAFSIKNMNELRDKIKIIRGSADNLKNSGWIAGNYVKENTGATKKIVHYIQANRLLTN